MKKLIIFAVAISVSFFSCSKDDGSTSKKQEQQTIKNQQQQTQNNNQNQNQNQNNNSSPASNVYPVKSIGNSAGKDQYVDFSWQENGQEKKLSDYKGKVILLNFWATWCGPCKRELPDLSKLSTELQSKDFKMIGISVDQESGAVDNFLRSNQLSYTVLHEPNELVMKYMSVSGQNDNVIPQTYIIDKKGKVVEALVGSRSKEDFMKILNKYL
jgi:peroxiredoxin